MITRRGFLAAGSAAALRAGKPARLKLGVMDGVLSLSGKPGALALAKKAGLQGVQVTLGQPARGANLLPLADRSLQRQFLAEAADRNIAIDSTYIDVLHVNCLKNDPLSRDWIAQGIEITKNLKAGILMTVFFGKCALESRPEIDYVAGVFKELAPEAEKAGVILGFENLIRAEDNARVMDRVASRAFKIYYDVGNAANMIGEDPAKAIRFLGRDRLCQFHFKDKGFLGEGKVDFRAVLNAISDIGFSGFANLETTSPTGSHEADLRRNLEYLRRLMA